MKSLSKIRIFLFVGILAASFLSACDPNESMPDETIVKYEGCQYYVDSTNTLVQIDVQFSFQDGDANIGLDKNMTDPPYNTFPYNKNFYMYVLDKNDAGDFVQMYDETGKYPFHFDARIEPFENSASLKGTMVMNIKESNLEFLKMYSKHKRVKFETFMYDIDLVKSNVVTTEEIRLDL